LMIAFETTLKHEINNLPTYVIESIGLYSTDALIGRADEAFPPGVRRLIPANVMDDFKKSGSMSSV
jgi:hypothetical protein